MLCPSTSWKLISWRNRNKIIFISFNLFCYGTMGPRSLRMYGRNFLGGLCVWCGGRGAPAALILIDTYFLRWSRSARWKVQSFLRQLACMIIGPWTYTTWVEYMIRDEYMLFYLSWLMCRATILRFKLWKKSTSLPQLWEVDCMTPNLWNGLYHLMKFQNRLNYPWSNFEKIQ
jgi:hypothetical protein